MSSDRAHFFIPGDTWRPRRPLAHLAAAYIAGIAFCYFLAPQRPLLIAGLAACAAIMVYKLVFRSTDLSSAQLLSPFMLLVIAVFLAGSLYSHYAFSRVDPLEREMSGGEGYVEDIVGHILFSEQRDPEYRVLTIWADGRKLLVRVYGESENAPEDMIGKRVSLTGELSYPDTARNPRCFDYRLFLLSTDIRIIVTCKSPEDVLVLEYEGKDVLWRTLSVFAHAKAAFIERVGAVLSPGNAALFAGMMFGDTREMEEETYDLFKRNGIAHILSVSGLHVGMVYAFVSMALGRRKSKQFYTIVLILLLCYAALASFSPPVMRAVTMIAVHIAAKLLHRRYDMLTGVLLSAFIMLLFNPLALFGLGFLLSYTAVCSLAFTLPLVERFSGFKSKLTGRPVKPGELTLFYGATQPEIFGGKVLKLLIPAALIQMFVLPLTVYYFNCLPLLATFVNIPVIALASLIVPFGLVVLVLSAAGAALPFLDAAFGPAAEIGATSSGVLLDIMLFFTRTLDQVPGSSPTVPSLPMYLIFLFYFGSFYLLSDTFAMKKGGLVLPFCIALATILIATAPATQQSSATYTFVDVGQGDCLHIRTADGRNYLMDGGGKDDYNVGKNVLAPYLLKNGVSRLDGIFVSHMHADHYKGLAELAEIIDVGPVYVYDGYRVNCEIEDVRYLAAGDVVLLGNRTRAEVLFPSRLSEDEYLWTMAGDVDENLTSLIIRFETDGISVLMTGDVSVDGELAALSISDLGCDILKIGHHGSKNSTSDALLEDADPAIAVIQVGKNSYGHPTAEVLDKLEAAGLPVYRNDESGAILIHPQTGGFSVQTVKRNFVSPMLLKPFEKDCFDTVERIC